MVVQVYRLSSGVWVSPSRPSLIAAVGSVAKFLSLPEPKAAHRGGSANWPEETLYAYTQAAAWSPSLALEISCWRSSDGVWVNSHNQTTGAIFTTDLDIPTNTWATLSACVSKVGGYPITRLDDIVTQFAVGDRVLFVENKGRNQPAAWLDYLDSVGGPSRFIIKTAVLGTTSQTLAAMAIARGYQVWGYYFPADTFVSSTIIYNCFTIMGMEYDDTQIRWDQIKALGMRIIGHIIGNTTNANAARAAGSKGLMVSNVTSVVPQGE